MTLYVRRNEDEDEKELRVARAKPQNISLRRVAEPKNTQELRVQLNQPRNNNLNVTKTQPKPQISVAKPKPIQNRVQITRTQPQPSPASTVRLSRPQGVADLSSVGIKQSTPNQRETSNIGRGVGVLREEAGELAGGLTDIVMRSTPLGALNHSANKEQAAIYEDRLRMTRRQSQSIINQYKRGEMSLQNAERLIRGLNQTEQELMASLNLANESNRAINPLQVLKGLGQGAATGVAQLVLEVGTAIADKTGKEKPTITFNENTLIGRINKAVFGRSEIISISDELAQRYPEKGNELGIVLAGAFLLALDVFDFGAGGARRGVKNLAGVGDDVITTISKLDDPALVSRYLEDAGLIDDAVISKYLDELVSTTDKTAIKTTLNNIVTETVVTDTARVANTAEEFNDLINTQVQQVRKIASPSKSKEIAARLQAKVDELGGAEQLVENTPKVATKQSDEIAEATVQATRQAEEIPEGANIAPQPEAQAARQGFVESDQLPSQATPPKTERVVPEGRARVSNGNSNAFIIRRKEVFGGKERDVIEIEAITSVEPRTGSATKLLEQIKKTADEEGRVVILKDKATPKSAYGGMPNTPKSPMSQQQLTKWYEKNGYKRLMLADGTPSDTMYRLPKRPKTEGVIPSPSTKKVLGQEKPRTISTGEDVLLRRRVRDEARGAKQGFKAGKKEGVQSIRVKVATRDSQRALRNRINRELSATKTRSQNGKRVGNYTPEIQKRLDGIRKTSKRKWEDARAEMLDIEQKMIALEAAGKEVPESMYRQIDDLRLAGMGSMDEAQLKRALEEIQYLKRTGRSIREEQRFITKTKRDNITNSVVDSVASSEGVPPAGSVAPDTSDLVEGVRNFMYSQHGLETLVRSISRYDTATAGFDSPLGVLAQNTRKANTAKNTLRLELNRRMVDGFSEVFGIDGKFKNRQVNKILNRMSRPRKLGEFKDLNGNKITLEMSQAEALGHHIKFQSPELLERYKVGNGWGDDIRKAISDSIDPDVKAWGEWQLKFYDQLYDVINPVYENKFGVPLEKVDNYSPVRTQNANVETSAGVFGEMNKYSVPSAGGGFLKSRTAKIQPILTADANTQLLQHLEEAAHFVAFDDIIGDWSAVLRDPRFKRVLDKQFGKTPYKQLEKHVREIANGGRRSAEAVSSVEGALRKLRTGFTKGVTGLNPRVMIKQTSSIPATLLDPQLSIGQALKGASEFFKNPVKNAQFLLKHSDALKARYRGGFDQNTMDALKDARKSRFSGVDTLTNKGMITVRAGDFAGLLPGMYANYITEFRRLVGNGVDEVTARTKAINTAEGVMQRTQQSGELLDLSPFQRGNEFVKLWTTFKNSPNQYYRLYANAVTDLIKRRGSRKRNLRTIAVAQLVLPMLFQYMNDGFEIEPENQARAALLGPINGLFIAGDIMSWAVNSATGGQVFGGPIEPPGAIENLIAIGTDVTDVIGQLFGDDAMTAEELGETVEEVIDNLAAALGIPYGNVRGVAEGATDALTNPELSAGDRIRRGMGYSEYVTGTGEYAETPAETSERNVPLQEYAEQLDEEKFNPLTALTPELQAIADNLTTIDDRKRAVEDGVITQQEFDAIEAARTAPNKDDIREFPDGLDSASKNILTAKDVTDKEVFEQSNMLSRGGTELLGWFNENFVGDSGFVPGNRNYVAEAIAYYNEQVAEKGLKSNSPQLVDLQRNMIKQVVNRTFEQQIGDIKGLSQDEIIQAYNNGGVSDEQIAALLTAEDYKNIMGAPASKYAKLRETFGYGYLSGAFSGGSGGSGSSSKIRLKPRILSGSGTSGFNAPRVNVNPRRTVRVSTSNRPGAGPRPKQIRLER